jgi:methyl-accepting chemotaxis protein
VATEVKQLATQTASATDEIRAQIEAIQAVTGEAVRAVQSIGTTVGEMTEIASAISATVQQQRGATQDIASNVVHAARGTQEVSANIAGVGDDAEQAAQAARRAFAAAQGVARRASDLQATVGRFVAEVRAA